MERLLILGASSGAREIYWYAKHFYPSEDISFYDDLVPVDILTIDGRPRPIYHQFKELQNYQFIVGVGEPFVKRILVEKALAAGLKPAPSIIDPRSHGDDFQIGRGGVITPGVVLTINIKIGDYVTLNPNSTVAHDSSIGDYCTINAGCHISGNVKIGSGVYLGAGATVREKITIASEIKVGTQACVVKDLIAPGVYVGVPAHKI